MLTKTTQIRGSAGFRNIRFKTYAGATHGGVDIFFVQIRTRALKSNKTETQRERLRAHGRMARNCERNMSNAIFHLQFSFTIFSFLICILYSPHNEAIARKIRCDRRALV